MKMTPEKLRQILVDQPDKEKWTTEAIEKKVAEYALTFDSDENTESDPGTISGVKSIIAKLMFGYPKDNFRFFQFNDSITCCVRMESATKATVSFAFLNPEDAEVPWLINGNVWIVDERLYSMYADSLNFNLPRNTLTGTKWGVYNTQRVLLSHMGDGRFTTLVDWQSTSLNTAVYAFNKMKDSFPTFAKNIKLATVAIVIGD